MYIFKMKMDKPFLQKAIKLFSLSTGNSGDAINIQDGLSNYLKVKPTNGGTSVRPWFRNSCKWCYQYYWTVEERTEKSDSSSFGHQMINLSNISHKVIVEAQYSKWCNIWLWVVRSVQMLMPYKMSQQLRCCARSKVSRRLLHQQTYKVLFTISFCRRHH